MAEIVDSPDLARPSGYSNGMRARGELLAVAGQVAWDANATIVGDDFVTQFAQALRNVCTVVSAAGGTPQDLIMLIIFVTDRQVYQDCVKQLGAPYRQVMGRRYPAMTLVEVKGLLEPGALVEIQGLAVLPERPSSA